MKTIAIVAYMLSAIGCSASPEPSYVNDAGANNITTSCGQSITTTINGEYEIGETCSNTIYDVKCFGPSPTSTCRDGTWNCQCIKDGVQVLEAKSIGCPLSPDNALIICLFPHNN